MACIIGLVSVVGWFIFSFHQDWLYGCGHADQTDRLGDGARSQVPSANSSVLHGGIHNVFLICGEALFDVFVELVEADVADGHATVLRAVAGGSPYNVAVGLSRLGRVVALATEISSDRLGRQLLAKLSAEGVDTSFIRHAAGATPMALVDVGEDGAPQYAFHGLREMCLHPVARVFEDRRADISGIHVGSFPIVSQRSSEKLLALIVGAEDLLVSLDPNIRLAIEPDTALWRRQLDRFRVHADLIKVSIEDLHAIYGEDAAVEEIVGSWLQAKTKVVVLTRGAQGGMLFTRGGARISIDAVTTAVVDTVGAGDTYQAALLCWLDEAGLASPAGVAQLTDRQVAEMAAFAARASAVTCSRRGADLPFRADLNAPPDNGQEAQQIA